MLDFPPTLDGRLYKLTSNADFIVTSDWFTIHQH